MLKSSLKKYKDDLIECLDGYRKKIRKGLNNFEKYKGDFIKTLNQYKEDLKEYLNVYKEDFDNYLGYAKNIKTWYKLIPNLLTIARPIGMIPANILFFTGNIIPALILTGCLLITDFFDGKLARKWGVQSKLGADLDAVSDKIMFLGMALPLLINYPVILINILGEAFIAAVNVKGRINGLNMKTVFSGKIKTWFLSCTLGLGYLVKFCHLPVSILRLLSIVTGVSQCVALNDYVSMYNEKMDEKENDVNEEENIIFENLNDKEQDKLLEQLKKEREFILSTVEPGKVYSGKKRVRLKMQEKKNN